MRNGLLAGETTGNRTTDDTKMMMGTTLINPLVEASKNKKKKKKKFKKSRSMKKSRSPKRGPLGLNHLGGALTSHRSEV